MNNYSLYDRLLQFGTIADSSDKIPDAKYALPSAVNWMKALALVAKNSDLTFKSAHKFYSKINARDNSNAELNTSFEQLLFGLNQISSLRAMLAVSNKADVARAAIMTWYYSIYNSGSAMIAVADGSFQEHHAPTANQWDKIFAANNLTMPPFSDRISNLLSKTIEEDLSNIRSRGKHSLTNTPRTVEQGWGCLAEYLSGCASWEQWKIEQRVRSQKDFIALGVSNFKCKDARTLRDNAFKKNSLSFLHQAIRYRGKANYRDAIFLAYGKNVSAVVANLVDDLDVVATAFSAMAAAYISRRVGSSIWSDFINDLEKKRSFSVSPKSIWS